MNKMVSVYVRYEIDRELMAIAEERNKMLRKEDKQIRQSTIIAEILEEWYKNQKRVMGVE